LIKFRTNLSVKEKLKIASQSPSNGMET